jgi:macrodomain Ter protein organizer (MatP/YcbG family)|tara:strand:+ start:144 stop:323 length:180 start_codon:yes stop_codon:yes gene_type:complete
MNKLMRNHENQEQIKTKKNVIITNMDKNLWNKFKGTCYTRGMSMNQAISELIETFVSEN